MAALTRCAAFALLLAPASVFAQGVAGWQPFMVEASQRFDVPMDWIAAVMRVESGGRTTLGGRPIVSRAGAMGLMQLMPATWAAMSDALALGRDPFDPHDNILAGTAYLRRMYDRFGYPGLFAAYNAGPERYRAWLAGRRPLPAETTGYLSRVSASASPMRAVPGPIFVVSRAVPREAAMPPRAAGLFAIAPRN